MTRHSYELSFYILYTQIWSLPVRYTCDRMAVVCTIKHVYPARNLSASQLRHSCGRQPVCRRPDIFTCLIAVYSPVSLFFFFLSLYNMYNSFPGRQGNEFCPMGKGGGCGAAQYETILEDNECSSHQGRYSHSSTVKTTILIVATTTDDSGSSCCELNVTHGTVRSAP